MLNRFKIGTKLIIGFAVVLLLLLLAAGVGYYALDASQKSTLAMLEVQDQYSDMQDYYQLVNMAQLHAVNGALFRDLSKEGERKKVDEKIKAIETKVDGKFGEKNAELFPELVKSYQDYVTEDVKWYRAEEKRVEAQKQLIEVAAQSVNAMDQCIELFKKAADETKSGESGAEKVNYNITQEIFQAEEFLTEIQGLRRDYFALMSEPNFVESQKLASATLKTGTELVTKLENFKAAVEAEFQEAIDKTINIVKNWTTLLNTNVNLLQEQSAVNAAQGADSTALTNTLTEMMSNLDERLASIRKTSDDVDALMNRILVGVTVFAVIVGIFFSLLLSRDITQGLARAAGAMDKVAIEGDVSFEISDKDLNRKDEIGGLAHGITAILREFRYVEKLATDLAEGNYNTSAQVRGERDTMNMNLNKMLDQVNATLREIDDSVKQVTTGSNEVSSAAQNLSSGAQSAAASLEEITASMSEISSQTKQNAESATQARDLAQKASKAATDGQTAMQNMTGAMERITKNSDEIQRVIKVIDDIAFQTNLLALNAAVEAARAGQHGKGFAVVAEEVRNLAARSAKAAKETSELIAKSGQEIEKGGEVATHTAGVLNTIVEQIKQTTDLVAGIAVASNEQAQGVGQVTIGLQQIDAVTQQNTASAEESASAANEMSAMATSLQKLVGQFKLRK